MTLVRFKNKPISPSFNNLVDDFFTGFPSLLRDDFRSNGARISTPVNIREAENAYVLEIVAPGFSKEDFKINLEENILTVAVEKEPVAQDQEKWIRNEYKFQSFKRSFTVDENINADSIDARYVNGVLILNLPKKEVVKEAAKQITIQ